MSEAREQYVWSLCRAPDTWNTLTVAGRGEAERTPGHDFLEGQMKKPRFEGSKMCEQLLRTGVSKDYFLEVAKSTS